MGIICGCGKVFLTKVTTPAILAMLTCSAAGHTCLAMLTMLTMLAILAILAMLAMLAMLTMLVMLAILTT